MFVSLRILVKGVMQASTPVWCMAGPFRYLQAPDEFHRYLNS